jgi:hypothetical protein
MGTRNSDDDVDKTQIQPVINMDDTGRRSAHFNRIRLDHSLEIAEADAEGIEHHVSEATLNALEDVTEGLKK